MQAVQARDVQVDICPSCRGLWFDRGELDLFPNRPSVKSLLAAARHAASRCKKLGHLVPRALAACATCRSAPVSCPGCGDRLALVTTPRCAVDVCASCESVWLDHGELELLEGVQLPPPATRSAPPARWEIPAATDSGVDPWRAPGGERALPNSSGRSAVRTSITCTHCSTALRVRDAWAFDGDIFCVTCRPPGSVSGDSLPADLVQIEGLPGAAKPTVRAYLSNLLSQLFPS